MTVDSLLRNVEGIGNLPVGALDAINRLTAGSYWDQLKPASFGGVALVSLGGAYRVGRRNAVHEYPFRDLPWVEDLGRQARRITVKGFLIGDDVAAQRDRLMAICESGKPNTLVHPTLGRRTVALIDATFEEDPQRGRVIMFTMVFVEQGQRQFPTSVLSGQKSVENALAPANQSTIAAFATKTIAALQSGLTAAAAIATQAQAWAATAIQAGNDASSLFNLASSLPGEFGRLFAQTKGITAGQIVAVVAGETIQSLEGVAAASRATVDGAAAALGSAAGSISPTTIDPFTAASLSMVSSIIGASPTPGDALKSLDVLHRFSTSSVPADGPAATAQEQAVLLFRRAAAVGMAQVSAAYTPASAQDAVNARELVVGALDDELTSAGDAGDDDVFTSMRSLRAFVVTDLNTRAATLPQLITVTFNAALPSLVLAQRLYGDPTRSDELVQRANPRNPLFMPLSFEALSS